MDDEGSKERPKNLSDLLFPFGRIIFRLLSLEFLRRQVMRKVVKVGRLCFGPLSLRLDIVTSIFHGALGGDVRQPLGAVMQRLLQTRS